MESLGTAARACRACREGKRKCTKELPQCSLCSKNGRVCDYDRRAQLAAPGPPPVSSPIRNPRGQLAESAIGLTSEESGVLRQPRPGHNRALFPPSFFLDAEAFALLQHGFERPSRGFTQETYIATPDRVRHNVDVYFSSTHTSFPIVSKLRLYQELGRKEGAQTCASIDTELLLLCMHLSTQLPDIPEEPFSWNAYQSAKARLSQVEAANVITLKLLQAALLIALYEISNAIYPAAYLTVGHCARLGHTLGLHSTTAPQKLVSPQTSTELEERRRTWWAVIILERYVNLGGTNRPFACEDASPEARLPMDDNSWDQGNLALIQPLAVSTRAEVPVPPFARTCQAAHLLSRVLRHLNDTDTDADFRYEEALQIDRTLQAFCSTLITDAENLVEKTSDFTSYLHFGAAMGLGYSALLGLYGKYSCAERHEVHELGNPGLLEMQRRAMLNLMEVCGAVSRLAQRVHAAADLGALLKTSPLLSNCFYEAGANYLWHMRETGSQEPQADVAEIEDVLGIMGSRWQCAREYIRLFEAYRPSES